MRLDKIKAALELARDLAASTVGLTIEEIQANHNVSRRTAERMRDVVEEGFGELERIRDGRQVRFRLRLAKGVNFLTAPTAEELAELMNLGQAMEKRDPARAGLLNSLALKISAALREADRRRLEPDIEVHLNTEVWAHTPGPVRLCDPDVLKTIRHALLTDRALDVRYRKVSEEALRSHRLVPYGLILGAYHYLVAGFPGGAEPYLLRLDRIEHACECNEAGRRPHDFDLRVYAERSFGVFQENPEQIELLFEAPAALEARSILFHPGQKLEELDRGKLRVTFMAGGLRELARFLDRWDDQVRAVAPNALKALMRLEPDPFDAIVREETGEVTGVYATEASGP